MTTIEKIQHDDRAMEVARVLAIANEAAIGHGTNIVQSLITITEEAPPSEHLWRIHYGPRDYKNRRGGDLVIVVNEHSGKAEKITRGQ